MNILPFDKQVAVIAALADGCSIRTTERLTDTHRDTIMRLGVRVGEGCAELHDRLMRGLHVSLILSLRSVGTHAGKPCRIKAIRLHALELYRERRLSGTLRVS